MNEPKIVIFDLEIIPDAKAAISFWPRMSAYPGLTLKASINTIACIGYQIYGEKKIHCLNAWDYEAWDKNVNDDSGPVADFLEVIKDADAVITQNGKRFDFPFLQTRLRANKLPFLGKIAHIDLKLVVKRNLYLFNNSLDVIANFLLNEKKMDHEGWDLWVAVVNKEPWALKKMTAYCKKDVDLTTRSFVELKPLINNIPNYNLWVKGPENVCPNCGSTRLKNNGWRHTTTTSYKRLICVDCQTWVRLNKNDKMPRSL
jgi:DNA polymerase elongation subunit (family B)